MLKSFIDLLLQRNRVIIFTILMLLIVGWYNYLHMSKEMSPDVKIPIIYVTTGLEGISAEDSERLLIKPMESHLSAIEGVKEMRSSAYSGSASLVLEFNVGFDSDKALADVRGKLDSIRSDIPRDALSLVAREINISLFPVLNIALSGSASDRELYWAADRLRDEIEVVHNVVEVSIVGKREEVVEILVSPTMIEAYNLRLDEVLNSLAYNNVMIPAGEISKDNGVFSIEVSGLIENANELLETPVLVRQGEVVLFKDIAQIKSSFKDPTSMARINSKKAVVLEVSKKTGSSALDVIDDVKSVVNKYIPFLPSNISISFSQDNSVPIKDNLSDLENNVIFATLLIVIVISVFMGLRSALLVAMSLPISFLIGIIIVSYAGFTLNIVVLFALILSVGILVDSAIVVTEYADRQMIAGSSRFEAYGSAAKAVVAPIISSTTTTIIVFFPLVFWPGIMGEFIFYLPTTLSATLVGSLLTSIVFLPTLGAVFGGVSAKSKKMIKSTLAIENGELDGLRRFYAVYAKMLMGALNNPIRYITLIISVSFVMIGGYFLFGRGVEFFPDVEPDNLSIDVRSAGNLSIHEKYLAMMEIESRIADLAPEFKAIYTRIGAQSSGKESSTGDLVGSMQLELVQWLKRRRASAIIADLWERVSDFAGFNVAVIKESQGPKGSKPVKIRVSSRYPEKVELYASRLVGFMQSNDKFLNIEDNINKLKISWNVVVDREKAALYGLNNAVIGNFIRMVTNGAKVSSYRPITGREEVDIVVRFPEESRNLGSIKSLRVPSVNGSVPIDSFTSIIPNNKIEEIHRVNRIRAITILANLSKDTSIELGLKDVSEWIASNYDPDVAVKFAGDYEDQNESKSFLYKAFVIAVSGVILVLLAQFNRVKYTFAIVTAIFFSTLGVFFGLLVTFRPFGIVMCGIGTITLAGVVVNNNILLIDAYMKNIASGMTVKKSIVVAAVSRIARILLTAATT
ncbi:efflux RND transporter permease subunit, partial [Candidatus Xenohaliotis californiensis]|uniref:efflux RND transporter permease subunit n=1 Tax=Candidatus Xenohaliotis californiensis TaxID=84677 RepID=UPI0030C7F3B3